MHYAKIIYFVAVEIALLYWVRDILYQFLMGAVSKKRFRNIRHAARPFADKVTLSYIRAYIKSDAEKQAFDRYHIYYICSAILIPVKLIIAIVVLEGQLLSFRYLVLLYVLSVVIKIFVCVHEQDTETGLTPHAGRKYSRKFPNVNSQDKPRGQNEDKA